MGHPEIADGIVTGLLLKNKLFIFINGWQKYFFYLELLQLRNKKTHQAYHERLKNPIIAS